MQTYNVTTKTRKLTTMALLSAPAVIMVALIHFPLLPAAPFLEYDPADIAILIGTFLFGPVSGLALTAIVSVLQGLTVSAASGPIGILMHFLATGAFSLTSGADLPQTPRYYRRGSGASRWHPCHDGDDEHL